MISPKFSQLGLRPRRPSIKRYHERFRAIMVKYQVTDLISHDITGFWAEFGYGKYLIVQVSSFGLAGHGILAYEPRLDQTRLIYRRSVPKRHDWV